MAENFILFLFLCLPVVLFWLTRFFFSKTLPRIKDRKIVSLVCGNLLVFLLLTSLCVLSGEVYFRYFYDSTDSFGLCKTTRRWFERHFHRNTAGFRDSVDYSFVAEEGVRRVTFLGDSFTAAHGVPDVERRFVNLYRSRNPTTDVHAIAQCGWDTGRQLETVNLFAGSNYTTDTVVLVYCLNDISDITPEWQSILDRIYEEPQPGFFATNSYLCNTLNARLQMSQEPEIADYYSFVRQAYAGSVWQQQEIRLAAMREAVINNGGEFYVVTFPFLHAIGDQYSYRHFHTQIDQFWSELGVPHLDLLNVFEDKPRKQLVVNPRDAHPSEFAHEIAAEAIDSFLEKHRK